MQSLTSIGTPLARSHACAAWWMVCSIWLKRCRSSFDCLMMAFLSIENPQNQRVRLDEWHMLKFLIGRGRSIECANGERKDCSFSQRCSASYAAEAMAGCAGMEALNSAGGFVCGVLFVVVCLFGFFVGLCFLVFFFGFFCVCSFV